MAREKLGRTRLLSVSAAILGGLYAFRQPCWLVPGSSSTESCVPTGSVAAQRCSGRAKGSKHGRRNYVLTKQARQAAADDRPEPLQSWGCLSGIYCINLDKRPERWAHMQEQFRMLNMGAKRWSAVDGEAIDLEKLVEGGELHPDAVPRLLLPDDQKMFGMDLTLGAIGCAMSHYQIWIDIMWRRGLGEFGDDDRAMFLVAEDDCEFIPGFNPEMLRTRVEEVPVDWEILFMGGVDALGVQHLLQVAPGVRRTYNGSRETTAYMINIEGVRTALTTVFPLMWQLDTQLTLRSRLVQGNPQLSYSIRPMGYHFWPPLVEQNKLDFPTDVQKDEHPVYLYGREGDTYCIHPDTWDLYDEMALLEDGYSNEAYQRYSLVASWSNWTRFHDLWQDGQSGSTYRTELQVPIGRPIEFQIVCDRDWTRRIFPTSQGSIQDGSSSEAHGNNWRLQAPPVNPDLEELPVMHVEWKPLSPSRSLTWTFGEPIIEALSRSYALAGSWNGWKSFEGLARDEELGMAVFVGSVDIPAGLEIEFQVICNRNWNQRMFPALRGGDILGPDAEISGHGRNWKLPAPLEDSILHVRFDPTGRRTLKCLLQRAADAMRDVQMMESFESNASSLGEATL
eukprot:TRINITY_DN101683_c0_g1_i1.p1 TRINITY_DN101683_c0_g1~~TRINITY_DN101683_c0_g1_i1.p1  ORF type:complete len:621 (+),score=56.39 TRINITY_DN101683_c0_g1_i1:91-1953(+)